MADHALRCSPLDAYADRLDAAGGETGLVSVAELPFCRQLTIRVAPGSTAAAAIERALGVALPGAPCSTAGRDGLDVLWMGPDEWLVVADECPPAAQLEAAAGPGATVVDVSGQRTVIALAGDAAREVLAKGCALDLDPLAFPRGACAQTLIARTQATLLAPSAEPGWWILVRSSFAGYLAEWLIDAAEEYSFAPDLAAVAA